MDYYDDPDYYKATFTKLVKSFEAKSVLTTKETDTYIDLMSSDGGPGAPFISVLCDLTNRTVQVDSEERALIDVLGELEPDLPAYQEFLASQR